MSIQRFAIDAAGKWTPVPVRHGFWVKHEDHIASHAYDEAKERELFEEWASSVNLSLDKMHANLPFLFKDPNVHCLWIGWKACAKYRAGIQS